MQIRAEHYSVRSQAEPWEREVRWFKLQAEPWGNEKRGGLSCSAELCAKNQLSMQIRAEHYRMRSQAEPWERETRWFKLQFGFVRKESVGHTDLCGARVNLVRGRAVKTRNEAV